MTKRGRPSTAREQILEAATELFFAQGYQSTGVSEIISQAGVSKPTFYAHFKSKEELCLCYLKERQAGDIARFKEYLRGEKDPYQRIFVPLLVLEDVQVATNFRGCPYFNMLSEMGQEMPMVRTEVSHVSKGFEAMFRDLVQELIDSDGDRYGGLDEDQLVGLYALLFNGAITLSQEGQNVEPIRIARQQLRLALEAGVARSAA